MDRVDEVLVKVLVDGPKPLNQLMKEIGLSTASVFKHLAHLKGAVSHEPIICRFEKGGWCKKTKKTCDQRACPLLKEISLI